MMKKLAPILALAIAASSCRSKLPQIETDSLPSPNPTNYLFQLPLAEVHEKAWQAFSMEHQEDHPIFGRSSDLSFQSDLAAECVTNAVFGEDVFRNPENTNDIYLHSFDMPFVLSPIYHGQGGALPFISRFQLHLAASGTNTLVSVIASGAEVIDGTKFGIGPCGPGKANNFVSVKPTTIEEYMILRYLGTYLGITNMPAVILPAR